MEASEVVMRLCRLQAEVQERVTGYENSADCFCGKGGLWGAQGYGGTFDEGYRNDGKALEFIEAAVREKIKRSIHSPQEDKEQPGNTMDTLADDEDAERYRWLRTRKVVLGLASAAVYKVESISTLTTARDFDTWVDSAMAETSSPQED